MIWTSPDSTSHSPFVPFGEVPQPEQLPNQRGPKSSPNRSTLHAVWTLVR